MEISNLKSQITLLQLTLRCSPDAQLSTELVVGSAPRDGLSPARFRSSDASSRDLLNPGERHTQTLKAHTTDTFTRENVDITWGDSLRWRYAKIFSIMHAVRFYVDDKAN